MSNLSGVGYVFATIGLQVISQLIFKARSLALSAKTGDQNASYLFAAMNDPWIWIAVAAAFAGMISWLLALAKVELSTAYPLVSLTFPIVAISGILIWNESIGASKAIGMSLMFGGLIVMSVSAGS